MTAQSQAAPHYPALRSHLGQKVIVPRGSA